MIKQGNEINEASFRDAMLNWHICPGEVSIVLFLIEIFVN